METFFINNTAYVIGAKVADKVIAVDGDATAAAGGDMNATGTMFDPTTSGAGKDSLLTSWPFVIGISVLILLVSIAFGTFLAKRKIKKGIDLYED